MLRTIVLLTMICVMLSACHSQSAPSYDIVFSMEGQAKTTPELSPTAGKRLKIAVVPKGAEIPYFKYAAEGVREAAKDLNIDVIFKGPEIADAGKQIDVVEQLIEQKVDLIAISANDPDKLVPILEKARRQGIKVITWDADTKPEARDFFVNMVEPEALGRHLMDTLANTMGEKGEFAIMTGSFSAANLNEWLKWIQIQHKEYYPNMQLIKVVATDDNLSKANEVARQLLAEHPELDGILGNSSVGPPAAAEAVKEAGKAGIVKVVGLSNPNLMRAYLYEGSVQTATLWSPKKLGYLTVALANNLLNGKMPTDGQEIMNVGNIRMIGDMVIMGEPLDFTKENVDQYDF